MTMKKGLGYLLVLLFAVSVTGVARTAMVTVSINNDMPYTAAREIEIHLVYTGNEVPTQMRAYGTGEDDWSEWFDYTDGLHWLLTGDDGLKTIKVETRYWLESRTDVTVYGAWRIVTGEDDIFLDMTPPVLTVSVTPDANENGWYNEPVSVVFQANDAGSGLATLPDDLTLDQEGAGQLVVGKAVDKAGNEAEVTVSGINIDMTPPVLTVSVTPDANENGWYNEPVSIDYATMDSLSGIASAPEDRAFRITAHVTLFPTATDKAGNTVNLPNIVFHIDVDDPLIVITEVDPGASLDVWIPGPVTVTSLSSDGFSGVAAIEHVKGAEVLAIDGGEQTVTTQVTDLAGNTSEISVSYINIDSTLPTTTILLVDSEGIGGANVHDPAPATIDLKAKLDAFGTYDAADVALGYAFEDAVGKPITDLNVFATVLEVGATGVANKISFFRFCEFAPTGGFYYFVLPTGVVSGQVYEVWFEDTTGLHTFKTQVTAL